jgi:aerobic C4-dicarboxylate transport protein
MFKQKLIFKLLKNLAFQVFIAIVAGIFFGVYLPEFSIKLQFISTQFINIIKLFICPIIFFTVSIGIATIGDIKKAGRIGIKSLIYFEIVTTLALLLGIIMAHLIEPGKIDLQLLSQKDASNYIKAAEKSFNWFEFLASNLTLQILIISIISGIYISYLNSKDALLIKMKKGSDFTFKLLSYVMLIAPIAAFCGIAFTVGKFGLGCLIPLGKLMFTMYLTMFLFVFVILGAIMYRFNMSIRKFIVYIKEELLLVFATSSSEPAMPSLMAKLEGIGCSKSIVGLVIPTGYSFNLDGTSIYLSMAVLFIAQLYQVPLSITEMLSILGILMITSKGAAGVTGSGFVVLASTLTALNKIPVEGLAFLLGIDKFMSEARAITNIIGNGVATLVISKLEKENSIKLN